MILQEKYMEMSLIERQSHIDLSDDCVLRGGISTNHRGVLAEYLNTRIFKAPVDLCHACNNAECSNPKHLYWGTRKENMADAIKAGTFNNPYQALVKKYGELHAKEILRKNGSKGWSKGGQAGKGKKRQPLSEEHKKKISHSMRNKKYGDVTQR